MRNDFTYGPEAGLKSMVQLIHAARRANLLPAGIGCVVAFLSRQRGGLGAGDVGERII